MGNIILIGFMGCGKTTVGRRLSYRLRQTMIDTDKWIETQEKKSVSEIFQQQGEAAFRQMETECLKQLIQNAQNEVISVGGGLPMTQANRPLLKELGTVIFLKVSPETILKRLKGDKKRPLLQGENVKEKVEALMEQRNPVYEECADIIIEVDHLKFTVILGKIEEALNEYTGN